MINKSYKNIILFTLFALFIESIAIAAEPRVFINNMPTDITINEGEPLIIPLFFVGGDLAGKQIELYVCKEDIQNGDTYYLDADLQWIPFVSFEEIQPILSEMIEYIYIPWKAFENTTGIDSFNLYICIAGYVDSIFTYGCGQGKININPAPPPPPPTCSGIVLSQNSISETVTRGMNKTIQIGVKDSCDQPIDFTASASQKWISLATQKGLLTVTLSSSSLSPGTYTGVIDITSGGNTARVNVTLKVNAPTINLPGGGSCTPSSISLWPNPVTMSVSAGETKSTTVSVTNNCGALVNYTATVTSGSTWLSVSPASGNGAITVNVNTAGMQSGSYTGIIQISASGYSPATLNVALTISGPCVVSSAVISPSSITQSATQGTNATNISVAVKDNCGNSLSYTVNSVSATYTPATGGSVVWISAPAANATGTGTMTVSFNSASLPVGTYSGRIEITPDGFNKTTIPVTLTINSTTGNVILLEDGWSKTLSYSPKEAKYFYFIANLVSPYPIQVTLEPRYNKYTGGDMLIRYAGQTCDGYPPTVADLEYVKSWCSQNGGCQPVWDNRTKKWNPPRARDDLYYSLNDLDSFEYVAIYGDPDNPLGCYYIMIYNESTVTNELTIRYREDFSK